LGVSRLTKQCRRTSPESADLHERFSHEHYLEQIDQMGTGLCRWPPGRLCGSTEVRLERGSATSLNSIQRRNHQLVALKWPPQSGPCSIMAVPGIAIPNSKDMA